MKPEKLRIIFIIIVAGLIGYGIGITKISFDWRNFQPQIQVSSKEPPAAVTAMDFSKFWDVLSKIEANYYNKTAIDQQKILNGAIAGMVDSLGDPYTLYLPPQQNNNFKQSLAGQFQGIGAELGLDGKQVMVVAPLAGSPSEKAGVKPGDIIIKVDGQQTVGWPLTKAVDQIRGLKGTPVTLTVLHKSQSQPVDIKVTRETITMDSVTQWTKKVKDITVVNQDSVLSQHSDDKIVYIRLSQFGDNTNKEWLKVTNTVANALRSDTAIKGVILDLRNNPGGYLTDAVFVASEFFKDGNVVLQENRNGDKTAFAATGKGVLTDVPLIVLINGGSASASEIVAGALQDHKRGQLVGEKSFGKGTIQEAADLGEGAGLHVTIAKWLTPNGRWVGNGKNGTGLTPDITVIYDTKDQAHDNQLQAAIAKLVQ